MKYSLVDIFSDGFGRQHAIPLAVSRRRKLSACVAAVAVGASLVTVEDVEAAGSRKSSRNKAPSVKVADRLELENAILREKVEALERREQEYLRRGVSGPGAVTPVPAVEQAAPGAEGTESAQTVAKQEVEENNDLGEVVVKARPRLEKVKDVPSSSSVRSGQELNRQLAQDLGAILQRAGNVKWDYGNPRQSSLSVRGVGKQGQTDAMDPSVGTEVDGVPYPYQPLTNFDFYDVDQVEVSRGPQGTAGGKNSILGVVKINNRRPSFTPDANYSVAYGDFNTVIADAAGGGAVIDNFLAWRGAIHVNKGEGETKNLYNPSQSWYDKDRVAGRVQLLFTPTEDFSALFSVDMQPRMYESTNGNNFFTPTPLTYSDPLHTPTNLNSDASTRLNRRWFVQGNPNYTYADSYLYGGGQKAFNQDAQQALVTSSKGGKAEFNWNIGDVKLTSITAARDYEFLASNDEGTPFDVSKLGGTDLPDYNQLSEEFRISSKFRDLVDYEAGVYYLDKTMTRNSRTGFGDDAGAWFANKSQYTTLDADGAGQALLKNSLSGLGRSEISYIHNETTSFFGQTKWHITDALALTTGLRYNLELREQPTSRLLDRYGFGAALNPGVVNGVDTGGFASDSSGELKKNTAEQLDIANSVAKQYFGKTSYNDLTPDEKAQVAAAKSLRKNQIGVLWDREPGQSFKSTQPTYVVSPSYKINDNLSSYVSWQYGEKAGLSQTVNGIAFRVEPEKTNSYEIGLKSTLFDNTLVLNTDFFWTDITNYQQAVQVLDQYTTNLDTSVPPTYTSATGNAAGVRALGVEIDGSYNGIPYTTISFSGAYNDAIYTDFKNSSNPVELNISGGPAYRDVTGQTLPGAAQFTFNIGPEVRLPLPVWGKNEFHVSFNTSFTSSYKSDVALSDYSWIKSNTYTDFAIGVGRRDQLFDVSLIAKNLFNNQTPYGVTWNSYQPGLPQWFGVRVSGKI